MEPETAERAKSATGADIFVGNAVDAPFLAHSFDVITCFDVLEHVPEPRQLVSKILEWLKPGGIFYAGLPNIDSWEARFLGRYWFGLELPRHLSHFSPRSLRHLMASVGFDEIAVVTSRTSYIERSSSYVYSAALQRIGISPLPMSKCRPKTLLSRAIRKGLRLSLIVPFGELASLAGAGASIEAVFVKNGSDVRKT